MSSSPPRFFPPGRGVPKVWDPAFSFQAQLGGDNNGTLAMQRLDGVIVQCSIPRYYCNDTRSQSALSNTYRHPLPKFQKCAD